MIDQAVIDLLHIALNVRQTQHKVASQNIASANVQGANKLSVNFHELLDQLANVSEENSASLLSEIKSNWDQIESNALKKSDGEIKLDQETAETLVASGKYKLIADGLNRKLGLMKLAVNGGRR